MKRLLLLPLLLLSLAGCAALDPGGRSILQGGSSVTAAIVNPVRPVDINRIKNTYAIVLTLADEWRAYCYARSYKTLMGDPIAAPVCRERRATVRRIQAAKNQSKAAVATAQNFITDNPTLSATTVLGAAWSAVQDFQSLVPSR